MKFVDIFFSLFIFSSICALSRNYIEKSLLLIRYTSWKRQKKNKHSIWISRKWLTRNRILVFASVDKNNKTKSNQQMSLSTFLYFEIFGKRHKIKPTKNHHLFAIFEKRSIQCNLLPFYLVFVCHYRLLCTQKWLRCL